MHLQSSAYLLGHEHLLVPMRSTQTYRCYRSIHVDSFFTVAASFLWSQFLQRRLIGWSGTSWLLCDPCLSRRIQRARRFQVLGHTAQRIHPERVLKLVHQYLHMSSLHFNYMHTTQLNEIPKADPVSLIRTSSNNGKYKTTSPQGIFVPTERWQLLYIRWKSPTVPPQLGLLWTLMPLPEITLAYRHHFAGFWGGPQAIG